MKHIERVLIVGLGSIGKRHLRIARELLPDADICVFRHTSCEDIPKYSNQCVDNIDAACNFLPQVAVIASPSPFHIESAINLLKVGCHLLIEKPLSNNNSKTEELVFQRNKQGTVVQVAYNLRFHAALNYFREQIKNNRIGSIHSVRCEIGQYLPTWRPNQDYRDGVSAKQSLGGGVLLELSHELDYLRWVFGEVENLSAHLKKHSKLDIDVEDSAYLHMSFKNNNSKGVVASLCMDFIRHDTTRICTAIGALGTLRWNAVTGTVDLWIEGAKEWKDLFTHKHRPDDTYHSEWMAFLRAVNNNLEPLVTIEDGIEVLKIIDAARISNLNYGKQVVLNKN